MMVEPLSARACAGERGEGRAEEVRGLTSTTLQQNAAVRQRASQLAALHVRRHYALAAMQGGTGAAAARADATQAG